MNPTEADRHRMMTEAEERADADRLAADRHLQMMAATIAAGLVSGNHMLGAPWVTERCVEIARGIVLHVTGGEAR